MIGTSLGPYKIIEQLGAGGMGEVTKEAASLLKHHKLKIVWTQSRRGGMFLRIES